jgi:hypothetical protein
MRVLCLGLGELHVEEAAFGVEHFEIARVALVVAHARQPHIVVLGLYLSIQREKKEKGTGELYSTIGAITAEVIFGAIALKV